MANDYPQCFAFSTPSTHRSTRAALAALLAYAMAMAGPPCLADYITVEIEAPNDLRASGTYNYHNLWILLSSLDADRDFRSLNRGLSSISRTTPLDEAVALIKIGAPEEIDSTRRINNTVRLTPVNDFDAFCDAIDYAHILEKKPSQRYLKIRIARGQLTKENIIQRARDTGRSSAIARLYKHEDEDDFPSLPIEQSELIQGRGFERRGSSEGPNRQSSLLGDH